VLYSKLIGNPEDWAHTSYFIIEKGKMIARDPTNPTVNDIWLADALVGSRSPAVVHALLGVRKIALGELEAGRKHWVIAKESGPQSGLVVDNLVRLAESIYSDQIPNLFDMITLAIEMYPENGNLYLSRGSYLKKLSRFEEAIVDLKTAEKKFPKSPMINQLLAQCFDELGKSDEAIIQTKIVQRKLNDLNTRERNLAEAMLRRLQ
ncbi:MAG: hypothetical protein AAF939_22885, partial [Planctomycetota bacterium]